MGGGPRGDSLGDGGVCGDGIPSRRETARESVAHTRAVIDEHLTHEENDFEPLLRPYLDTPEWKTVEKQTRRTSVPSVSTSD